MLCKKKKKKVFKANAIKKKKSSCLFRTGWVSRRISKLNLTPLLRLRHRKAWGRGDEGEE